MNKIKIDIPLVRELIKRQFPLYTNLSIVKVENDGNDNRTFRLGGDKIIRLPSSEVYSKGVENEWSILESIKPFVSVATPIPLEKGVGCDIYPWSFSIYKWINGVDGEQIEFSKEDISSLGNDLAKFLKEIHSVDARDIRTLGIENFYRGGNLAHYKDEAIENITKLKYLIDTEKALKILTVSLSSKWKERPVIVHGDLVKSNILIKSKFLSGVIDFGCSAAGDPACDLTAYWSIFEGHSAEIFKKQVDLDKETWERAKGWMLWKATYELVAMRNRKNNRYNHFSKIIKNILLE